MKAMEITRKQFLKTIGALVVTFNLFSPARKALAQFATLPSGDIDPTSLDSWLAITPDDAPAGCHARCGRALGRQRSRFNRFGLHGPASCARQRQDHAPARETCS